MEETEKAKQYGHYFKFEPGDEAVSIIPSDYSKLVDKVDMSQPQVVKRIYKETLIAGKWYQIVEFENGIKESALNLRAPDDMYDREMELEHHYFMQDLRGGASNAKPPPKPRANTKLKPKPTKKLPAGFKLKASKNTKKDD